MGAPPPLILRRAPFATGAGALRWGVPRARSALPLAIAVALLTSARARADETYGLSIAIAEEERAAVQSEAWLNEQIANAERLFGPIGVHVRWTLVKPLAQPHARLETRKDRDVLADQLEPGAINVFVVAQLRDVDDPSLYRMGVCWRRGDGKPYVIVAATARPTVLAHELGHFFGNPHSTVPNNIMSYVRTDGDVFFDEAQMKTIRFFSKKHVADKWIVPLGPPKFLP